METDLAAKDQADQLNLDLQSELSKKDAMVKQLKNEKDGLQSELGIKSKEMESLKDDLQSKLSKKDDMVKQLENEKDGLQSELGIKLKEMESLKDENQTLIKKYTQLVEKKENVKEYEEQDSEVFSQFDSLEYDSKVSQHNPYSYMNCMYVVILKEKKTVLHYGAIVGCIPLVRVLIKFGTDVNAVDKVCQFHNYEDIQWLLGNIKQLHHNDYNDNKETLFLATKLFNKVDYSYMHPMN